VRCTGVVKDPRSGAITEIRATYDPETRSGNAPDGRKVKATIHWVSATHAVDAEVRLYEPLFALENPEDVPEGADFISALNPASIEVLTRCKLEAALSSASPGVVLQFERLGYFVADAVDSRPGALVFNRTVTLKDAWARAERKQSSR
jgi:glutaminyl-tRNA synthetase